MIADHTECAAVVWVPVGYDASGVGVRQRFWLSLQDQKSAGIRQEKGVFMGRRTVLKKSVIGIRIFSYSVFTFVMIAGLTLAVNITFWC